jgi:regulator of protease activity HflC (stomatin/prohibitin superfamily)
VEASRKPDWAFFYSLVRGARFRRRLFGYHPDDVHEHLYRVSTWFSLAGIDKLLEERAEERMQKIADQADQRRGEAEAEATRVLTDARREADAIERGAQEASRAILEQARREAALKRRGRSRLGRPVGARSDVR